MTDERLSKATQENLLVVLSFNDDKCKLVRNTVELSLFEGVYKDMAKQIYHYIDDYSQPPKDHLYDIFEDIINGKDSKKGALIKSLIQSLGRVRDTINVEYTMDQLESFVRHQNLKAGVLEAATLLQEGGPNSLEKVEEVLNDRLKRRLSLFDAGIFLNDTTKSLRFLDNMDNNAFPTSIPELDIRGLGPIRKGLHLFIGPAGSGKTQWLVNLGRQALLSKLKVCHITLEMDEDLMACRYYQSFFSLPKRKTEYRVYRFQTDSAGMLLDVQRKDLIAQFCLTDPDAKELLTSKIRRFGKRFNNLVIKQFPTGSLNITSLKAYLDSLEDSHKFIPDLLIVDYADLMTVKSDNYRLDLGNIYKDLRGIAMERNIAVATASQSNREGAKKKTVKETDVAEDYSKIATVDCAITYSQTDSEREMGLARLYVGKARSDEGKFQLLISQSYATGQFCIDSMFMHGQYEDLVTNVAAREKLTP